MTPRVSSQFPLIDEPCLEYADIREHGLVPDMERTFAATRSSVHHMQNEKKRRLDILINDGFGYQCHNTLFTSAFILPSAIICVTVKHGIYGFVRLMSRCFRCISALFCCGNGSSREGLFFGESSGGSEVVDALGVELSGWRGGGIGQNEISSHPTKTYRDAQHTTRLYVSAKVSREGQDVSSSSIKCIPCHLYCKLDSDVISTDPRDNIPKCDCLRCRLHEFDLMNSKNPSSCCLYRPPLESTSTHELLVDWIRCVIRLVWLNLKSPCSLRVARFFTDTSLANKPILRETFIPRIHDTFRAVRKRNADGRSTSQREEWGYVLWKRKQTPDFEKWVMRKAAEGACCQSRRCGNPQMLTWKQCMKGIPEGEVETAGAGNGGKVETAGGGRSSSTHAVSERSSRSASSTPLIALREAERVLFYTHGGAFVTCDADMALAVGMYDLVHRADCFVYACNYRRAPEHDIATDSINDVLAEYKFLVEKLRVDPKKIVVIGESAGAALTLQLVVKLRDMRKEKDMMPAAAVLLSPWCDLSDRALVADSMYVNARRDLIAPNAIRMLAKDVAGNRERTDPGVSVVYHFEGGSRDQGRGDYVRVEDVGEKVGEVQDHVKEDVKVVSGIGRDSGREIESSEGRDGNRSSLGEESWNDAVSEIQEAGIELIVDECEEKTDKNTNSNKKSLPSNNNKTRTPEQHQHQHHLLPPILIHTGERELLRDSVIRLGQVLRAYSEEVVFEVHNIVHAGHLFAACHEPSNVAMDRVAEFVREKVAVERSKVVKNKITSEEFGEEGLGEV